MNGRLALIVAVVVGLVLMVPVRPAAAAAEFQHFTVPAGAHDYQLQFSSGVRPPINVLILIAGGSPDIKISRVVGTTNGLPDIVFNPPATPFEFTINSVQRPLFNSPSADFVFTVQNDGDQDHVINIGAVFR